MVARTIWLHQPDFPTPAVSLSDPFIGIYDPNNPSTIGAPLAKPESMKCKWAESFTNSDDSTSDTEVYEKVEPNDGDFRSSEVGAVWRAECPEGYKALSDVASQPSRSRMEGSDGLNKQCANGFSVEPGDSDYPDKNFMCVNKDLLKPVPLQNNIYPDNCSWEVNVYPMTDGFFVGNCQGRPTTPVTSGPPYPAV
jgi:hypothetical protein